MVASPRKAARGLRNVPLSFDNPELLQLAHAVIQLQQRSIKHPLEAVSTTATYTMLDIDILVKVDATDGDRTVFLPTAAGRTGRRAGVKKIDTSANLVTIDPSGTETIDGDTTVVLASPQAYREMVSDGVNWILVAAIGYTT